MLDWMLLCLMSDKVLENIVLMVIDCERFKNTLERIGEVMLINVNYSCHKMI